MRSLRNVFFAFVFIATLFSFPAQSFEGYDSDTRIEDYSITFASKGAESLDPYDKLVVHGEETDAAFVDSETTPKAITNNSVLYSTTHQLGSGSMLFPGGNDIYTKILLHGDATPITDSSVAARGNQTEAGSPATYSTVDKEFGTGSILFVAASSQLITYADHDDWNFGTGSFTIDFWIKFNTLPAAGKFNAIIHQAEAGGKELALYLLNTGGVYSWNYYDYSTPTTNINLKENTTIVADTWYHIALVRNVNSWRFYQNGVGLGTATTNSGTMTDVGGTLKIGSTISWEANSLFFDGYLDELRISKGIARWISGFTPLIAAYATSYLTIPDSDDWAFGTGNFTIDFWLKTNHLNSEQYILDQYQSSTYRWFVRLDVNNKIVFYSIINNVVKGYFLTTDIAISDLNWHHIAIVRTSDAPKVFIDGTSVQVTIGTAFDNLVSITGDLAIGRNNGNGYSYLEGYLDELRISKGVARWTSHFDVLTTEYDYTDDPPTPLPNSIYLFKKNGKLWTKDSAGSIKLVASA